MDSNRPSHSPSKPVRVSRREFVHRTVAAAGILGFPTIIPSRALGANAPSNRIAMGHVGLGGMGTGDMKGFMGKPDAQIVALCDVDSNHLERARQAAGLDIKDCTKDFRELVARDDLDAVCVATPDHWHVLASLGAVRHGKDVYCEKPLTLTIHEGRVLAEAVERYGRVLQTGSQQRSDRKFRQACELVRNGKIGRLHTVRVDIPGNNRENPIDWKPQPVPPELDYDMWLGRAPWAPYTPERCHYTFRFILDYSGGQMTNWGAHYLDIAQWGIGADDSGPVAVDGKGKFPAKGLFTTAVEANITYTYANGVKLILTQGLPGNTRFEGEEGWVTVNRGRIDAEPKSLLEYKTKPNEIHLYESHDHKQNFLDCVKSRRQPVASAQVGHRSATVCHLGNISMLLDRKLEWDPQREEFVNDEEANEMVSRKLRSPWRL